VVEITEIRIKLMEGSEDRLRGFCSITIDQAFVVRDLKIIDGSSGPFVAMPSRKLTSHCGRCGQKNHLRASYCNHCGNSLPGPGHLADSPQKLYADVAHPINSECREMIQEAVIQEFEAELARSRQPGYRSRYDDDFDAGDYDESDYSGATATSRKVDGSAKTTNRIDVPDGINRRHTETASTVVSTAASDSSKHPSEVERSEKAGSDPSRDFGRGLLDDDSVAVIHNQADDDEKVPRPHFQDRHGGGRGVQARTSTGPKPQDVSGGAPEEDDESGDDYAGFGAGIFDN